MSKIQEQEEKENMSTTKKATVVTRYFLVFKFEEEASTGGTVSGLGALDELLPSISAPPKKQVGGDWTICSMEEKNGKLQRDSRCDILRQPVPTGQGKAVCETRPDRWEIDMFQKEKYGPNAVPILNLESISNDGQNGGDLYTNAGSDRVELDVVDLWRMPLDGDFVDPLPTYYQVHLLYL